MSRAGLAALVAVAALAAARSAHAGENDLVLGRLGQLVTDESGAAVDAVGDAQSFRSVASELGAALAPPVGGPAETTGLSGFDVAADVGWTRIHGDRGYWRARAGSSSADFLPTIGGFARKGLWPSLELGVGAVHLLDSRLWAAQASLKLAVLEGYPDLPAPSVALRLGASRMLGSEQMVLTVLTADLVASRRFVVAGSARVTPYAGWAELVVRPRSKVIEMTPAVDPRVDPADGALDFAFPDQDFILRHRGTAGVLVEHRAVALTVEAGLTVRGRSRDDVEGTAVACADAPAPTASCDSRDRAGGQLVLRAGLGLTF